MEWADPAGQVGGSLLEGRPEIPYLHRLRIGVYIKRSLLESVFWKCHTYKKKTQLNRPSSYFLILGWRHKTVYLMNDSPFWNFKHRFVTEYSFCPSSFIVLQNHKESSDRGSRWCREHSMWRGLPSHLWDNAPCDHHHNHLQPSPLLSKLEEQRLGKGGKEKAKGGNNSKWARKLIVLSGKFSFLLDDRCSQWTLKKKTQV